MRKCHLFKQIHLPDGSVEDVVIYSGTQASHMQHLVNHLSRKGEMVSIVKEKSHTRRKRINPLTNKPFRRITRKSYDPC